MAPRPTHHRSPPKKRTEAHIVQADLSLPTHQQAVIDLTNAYRMDKMGGKLLPMRIDHELLLIRELRDHPTTFVLLCSMDNETFVGLLVGFWGLSTFQTRPQLNIHDLVVKKRWRGQGLGRELLATAGKEARRRGCCRVTLEVRSDNTAAQQLYRSVGFAPCEPMMEYWQWKI